MSKNQENLSVQAIINTIEKISNDDLKTILQEITKEQEKRLSTNRKNTAKQIRDMAANVGLIVDIKFDNEYHPGVAEIPDKKKKTEAKYQDPDDKNKTWSGRGVRPKWLKEKLDQGHSLEEFLIKD